MDTPTYVLFLGIGIALVLIDGQLLLRSGRRYLTEASRDQAATDSISQLVGVLFHLVVLGVVALISVFMWQAATSARTIVVNLGILLLVLAVAHAATVLVFAWLRRRQREQELADDVTQQLGQRQHPGTPETAWHPGMPETTPRVTPVEGRPGSFPARATDHEGTRHG